MPGIYIHIPFCRRKCNYCDFYSITDTSQSELYIDAVIKEINNFNNKFDIIDSIFIGGGTPSILSPVQIEKLFRALYDKFPISQNAEITIESNPESLHEEKLEAYKKSGINRLSIGFQSLDNNLLEFLSRPHTSRKAIEIYSRASYVGFNNINIDLIFGIPGQNLESWKDTIDRTLSINPDHLSVYNLIYEAGTPLAKLKSEGKIAGVNEEMELEMYEYLCLKCKYAFYEQYEISNFALDGKKCKHNLNYWRRGEYAGFGVSAHSFVGNVRSSNISNVGEYISRINNNIDIKDIVEIIDADTAIIEELMLGLRSEGISIDLLKRINLLEKTEKFISSGYGRLTNSKFKLNQRGYFICDEIINDFIKYF